MKSAKKYDYNEIFLSLSELISQTFTKLSSFFKAITCYFENRLNGDGQKLRIVLLKLQIIY